MGSGTQAQGAVPQQDVNSETIQNLNKLAEHYATNSDYNKAIEYFVKMTNLCRKNGSAWTALGHCYLLKEDLQKSFQAYQNALYHLDNIMDPQLWYGIGILYEKFESYEHAISSLMAVLKMSPNFYQKSEVLSRLGYIFARTNQIDSAINYFQSSIQGNSFPPKRKVEILLKIGLLQEETNSFPEAQQSYEQALIFDQENNYIIFQHLAWALYQQQKPFEAIQQLKNAEAAKHDDPETLYIKARCLQDTESFDDSARTYQQLIEQPNTANSAIYWCSLAVLLYKQSKCEEAFEKIISATKLNGTMFESWYNFGILYEKCKQADEAVVAYNKALEICPDNNDAQIRLQAIKGSNYNIDNQQLPMKFPNFKVSNNLVIDRSYRLPTQQNSLGSIQNILGGAAPPSGEQNFNQSAVQLQISGNPISPEQLQQPPQTQNQPQPGQVQQPEQPSQMNGFTQQPINPMMQQQQFPNQQQPATQQT